MNVTKITNVNNVMIFNEGPDFTQIQRRTEQPIRWARLERRWDVNRDVVRGGEVRNRFEGDVFHVVAPRVERSNREGRPSKVTTTVRREEFDERIGQERRRVRERTREMDRSAEADIPPPPDGRDQRFDPRREDLGDVPADQRVTDGQGRRERGSREPESETLGNQQQSQDQTRGRDRQGRQERRDGPEDSSQTPPASDQPRLEADQATPPGSQPSREERRRGRTGAQGQSQDREMQQDQEGRTRSASNSARRINRKNLAKDLLPDNQKRRGRLLERELKAVTARHSGLRKMARRNAEQAKGRISSVGKTAAQTNLNNLSRELLLHRQVIRQRGRPLGRKPKAVTARHSGLRRMARRNAEQAKGRISNAGKAAAQINLNRRKPLHRRSHHRPTALVVSPHASEVSAAGVSKMQPKSLARAAAIQSGLPDSESRPKLQKHLLKMCSSVARVGKTPVRSKGVARLQSAANPMFNRSRRAATRKLKGRNPAARRVSSRNRRVAVKRKKRVTRKAKARAINKAVKGKARTIEASKRSSAFMGLP